MVSWDDLRFVLAVARAGSLASAARALGVTQPTPGRRISQLERRLGIRLFQRTGTGLVPTAAARRMIGAVERMEAAASLATRAALDHVEGVRGRVRITTTEWLATRVLGPVLAPLADRNVGLVLEIVADARHYNLVKREADLAIRPRAFEQRSVYQRRIGRVEFALYASGDYLARRGVSLADGAAGHTMVAMADDVGDVARSWIATHAREARIAIYANGREQMAALAAGGIGLACLPRLVGDATPGLRRVDTAVALPVRALWLGVHHDMRDVPRVRATIDALAAAAQHVPGLQ